MKLKYIILIILIFIVRIQLYSQTITFNIKLKKTSLVKLFDEIERQSEYRFFYNKNVVNEKAEITVSFKNAELTTILNSVLYRHMLDYKISGNDIIIRHSNKNLRQIIGKVISEDGMPLPGVTIKENNTDNGAVTNSDGEYSINMLGTQLTFSFIGMKTQVVDVADDYEVNVVLEQNISDLNEVVVTALGIKREERMLTYSTQRVKKEEVSKAKEVNFVNSLSGKTSGIEIRSSASGMGGSTKILLRGNKSIFGSSDPLFVIDGIPMVNNKTSNPFDFWGGRDGGDGLSQINPDDIEDITVLKGSNAAALYGSQGANGVVMISTKKGETGKLKGVFSSSVTMSEALDIPKMQYKYGHENTNLLSWSNSHTGQQDNFVDNFFRKGINTVNSISISGGTKRYGNYFSYSNTHNEGIVPTQMYNKHNITFKQNISLLRNKLQLSTNVMLVDERVINKSQLGYYYNPLTGLYLFPRDKDFNEYKDNYEVFSDARNLKIQNWHTTEDIQQNPYWILNNNRNEDRNRRVISNVSLKYNIVDNLSLQLRANIDYANRIYEKQVKAGSSLVLSHENGRWDFEDYKDMQQYVDMIVEYKYNYKKFSLDAVFGCSFEKTVLKDGIKVDSDTHGLYYANVFTMQNLAPNVLVQNTMSGRLLKQGVFSNVQLGYNEMIFFDISGRNDWASSLAGTGNESYFYPAFGMSSILNEMFNLPSFINLAKLRASYSIVGNQVPAFKTMTVSQITGKGYIKDSNEAPFSTLKPERQKSFEVGVDLRMFSGRFNIDFTYYDISNTDQFLRLEAAEGSSYNNFWVNAGHIQNRGIELTTSVVPVKLNDFDWKVDVNYSYNRNKIISLHEKLDTPIKLSSMDDYQMIIEEGGSFGDIYVSKFKRNDNGKIMLGESGVPLKTDLPQKIGSSNPDFILGVNNILSYKNFSLSFLIDSKIGGKTLSMTEALLDGYGVSERTATARERGYVEIDAVDVNGNAVTRIDPKLYYTTTGGRDGIKEPYVYDATTFKLRQLVLSYKFSFKRTLLKSFSLSFIANNLFYFKRNSPQDTDITLSTGNALQGVHLFNTPAVRTYGVNLSFKF